MMRVIAGKAKRLKLVTIEGNDTRPTTDRVKETLFNILQPDLPGCRFLDLFAGSGAIGIEALSRGAKEAVFVENGRRVLNCIKDNLQTTRLFSQARVMECDVLSALTRLEREKEPFDIIFMDPPYDRGLEQQVLTALRQSCLVTEDTLIIVEASLETEFDYTESLGYEIVREKIYKTNKHIFLQKVSA